MDEGGCQSQSCLILRRREQQGEGTRRSPTYDSRAEATATRAAAKTPRMIVLEGLKEGEGYPMVPASPNIRFVELFQQRITTPTQTLIVMSRL